MITCPADRRRCLSVLRAKGMTMLQESVKDVDQENIKTKMKRREPHARIVSRANIRRRKTKRLVRIVPRARTRKTLVNRHAMAVPKARIRLRRARLTVTLALTASTPHLLASQRARSAVKVHTLKVRVHQNASLVLQDDSKKKISPQNISAPRALQVSSLSMSNQHARIVPTDTTKHPTMK